MMKALMIIALIFAVGCNRTVEVEAEKSRQPEKEKPAGKSSLELAVDGFTGKYAVDAKRKAETKLRKIYAEEQKALEEVLKE